MMQWSADRNTLRSSNPPGYTVVKNRIYDRPIFEAYGPRINGNINLLQVCDTGREARSICQQHAEHTAAPVQLANNEQDARQAAREPARQ
jgi:hypothetical protein